MTRPRLLHLLVVALYAVAAALVAWAVPGALATRLLAGAAVFLGAALLHEFLARRADHRWFARELARLRLAQRDTAAALSELQTAIGYAAASDGAPDLMGEMRTIRGLLKKLTDRSVVARERAEGALARAAAADPVEARLSDAQVLNILQAALAGNRVDLYLQPIVTLPQRKVRYYEAFGRIRTESGNVLLPDQYRAVASAEGLLPTIDNLMLFRCVQSVRRAWKEKLDVGFFCNLSREALLDADFFPQFLDFLERNKELGESLVFELSQETASDMRLALGLAGVRRLGFAFSLDNVGNLQLDLDNLARRGFRFLKLEAAQLLSKESQARLPIHIADLGEKLKRTGIQLIAEKVEEEPQVLGLLDLNITLAQGYLLGEPRPLREAV